MEPGTPQQCLAWGHKAKSTIGTPELPPDLQRSVWMTALAQIARRGCKVSSEISKNCRGVVLGNLLWVSLLEQRLDQMDPKVPSSLNYSDSIILWKKKTERPKDRQKTTSATGQIKYWSRWICGLTVQSFLKLSFWEKK